MVRLVVVLVTLAVVTIFVLVVRATSSLTKTLRERSIYLILAVSSPVLNINWSSLCMPWDCISGRCWCITNRLLRHPIILIMLLNPLRPLITLNMSIILLHLLNPVVTQVRISSSLHLSFLEINLRPALRRWKSMNRTYIISAVR